jgi:rhodanese-related sulfurtransferase
MVDEITPEAVESLLEAEGLRIVDIRSRPAFDRGHIPGSVNVPLAELPDRIEEIAGADRIVTICPHGKSSVQAARLISSYEGVGDTPVESMAGGLDAWEGPLEAADTADRGDTSEAPF